MTFKATYTRDEVADLVRRDCQKRTCFTIVARHVSVNNDGSIDITIYPENTDIKTEKNTCL